MNRPILTGLAAFALATALLLALTLTASAAHEGPPVLTVGGTATYTEGGASVVIAPDLTLTYPGGHNIDGVKVTIGANFNPAQDGLGIQGSLPAVISSLYNSSTGVLTLTGSGSPADYQQALRQVTYSNSSQNPSAAPRTVTFNIGSTLASGTGHFYHFVPSEDISWTAAKAAAGGSSLHGLQGYLATITSSAENAFIKEKLQGNGWLGGSDKDSESIWKWMSGPERDHDLRRQRPLRRCRI